MDTAPLPTPADNIEIHIRQNDRRNRIVSLAISVCLVALLLAALAWIGLTISPIPDPPVVEVSPNTRTFKPTTCGFPERRSFRRKPAPPSAAPTSAIAAVRSSPISIPTSATPSDSPELGVDWGIGIGVGSGNAFGFGGVGGIPGGHAQRCSAADRAERLVKAGGTRDMDKSVLRSLRWIKEQQHDDGHWGEKFPVAMTAFALLCYSGHCETVDSPEFGDSVRRAIGYLASVSEANKGMMASRHDRYLSYEHAIAVYSLAEAYSMNKNARKPFKRISPILKKGVPIIIEGQTNGGGWLYSYGSNGTGDLSVAGWNIQALKAAEFTGLKFSGIAAAQKKARRYLSAAEHPDGKAGLFKYRVNDGQSGRLALTGVGLLCSRMLGDPSELESPGFEMIQAAAPKKWASPNLYAWYYHSQAAFQSGGKAWQNFNAAYQKLVFDSQLKDGSWSEAGGHAATTGPDIHLYSTCLSTLMMEVYYRYLPTGGKA